MHPLIDGVTLSIIFLTTPPCNLISVLLQYFHGFIGRSTITNNILQVRVLLSDDRFNRCFYELSLIIRRRYNCYLWIFQFHAIIDLNYCCFTILAGLPTTVQPSGTSLKTTAPAPIVTLLPIRIGPKTVAPVIIFTLSPIIGRPS